MAFADPKRNIQEFGLGEGMAVAEFGAGAGYYALEAARRVGDGGKVFAVDIQRDLLAKLKREAEHQKLENVAVIWGDVEEEGGSHLAAESVHAVLIVNALFQMDDKAAVFAEAFRVLKPKGRLLVIDWSDSFSGLGPHPDAVVPTESVEAFAEEVGFEREDFLGAGEHHYGLIFRKPRT